MHNTKKNLVLLVLFINLIVLICFLPGEKVQASTIAPISGKRLWGKDRYETAASICGEGWSTSEYAVLASGENFPDALCAAPLAKKLKNAPILLTEKDVLNASAEAQIKRIGAKSVYIVGGTGVVSTAVENRLHELGINTQRIGGRDRYETSVKIAEAVGFNGKIMVASGENFADALSAAPIAAENGFPILLSETSSTPDSVRTYIQGKNINTSYIIGGTGAVTEDAVRIFNNKIRLWGATRYETNVAILNEFYDSISHNKLYVTSGQNYADAVAGSALAALNLSGLILTDQNLSKTTGDFISSKIDKTVKVFIFGGTGAVSNAAVNGVYTSIGYYKLVNQNTYEYKETITITNDGGSEVKNINAVMYLGKINDSPYQTNEVLYVNGPGVNITKDDDGNYIANINVQSLSQGQKLQYEVVRRFINGGIQYNVDLADTSSDYTGFTYYNKYISPETKIESDNTAIKNKALEIIQNETNAYLKAKKIFDFVNTYMSYDSAEANKGAYNALLTGKGVCEDYSDLMVAMARAVGIPSRVVYGYWVDSKSLLTNIQDITNFSHSWVEFYLPEYGWIFAEPTVDPKKVTTDDYFANYADGGHFALTYKNNIGFSCQYTGYSPLSIDDVPSISVISN